MWLIWRHKNSRQFSLHSFGITPLGCSCLTIVLKLIVLSAELQGTFQIFLVRINVVFQFSLQISMMLGSDPSLSVRRASHRHNLSVRGLGGGGLQLVITI